MVNLSLGHAHRWIIIHGHKYTIHYIHFTIHCPVTKFPDSRVPIPAAPWPYSQFPGFPFPYSIPLLPVLIPEFQFLFPASISSFPFSCFLPGFHFFFPCFYLFFALSISFIRLPFLYCFFTNACTVLYHVHLSLTWISIPVLPSSFLTPHSILLYSISQFHLPYLPIPLFPFHLCLSLFLATHFRYSATR